MARTNSRYGWLRDLPDQRDFHFAAPRDIQANLPPAVDLVPQGPPVYDQGQRGSCTGNGVVGVVQFDALQEGLADTSTPSLLFIYYNERVIEGTVEPDARAQIRDGIKTVAATGVCDETLWPHDIAKFNVKPKAAAYTAAKKQRAISYSLVSQSLSQLQGCLASGYPIVFGFTMYDSFESAQVASTGAVPMAGAAESVLGGHCVVAVGYDDASQRFTIRNSCGIGWGPAGYATMPYTDLLSQSLASDFWIIKSTTCITTAQTGRWTLPASTSAWWSPIAKVT